MLARLRDPRQQVEYQAGQRAVIAFWYIPEAERLAQMVNGQHTIQQQRAVIALHDFRIIRVVGEARQVPRNDCLQDVGLGQEPVIGVNVEKFFVQKMKTKWGSCNAASKSIRLNTNLAKKPPGCLEYIVVHEMVHLVVRHHNDQFSSLMNTCLPEWKLLRQMLNSAPLAHTDWVY